MSSSNRMNFGQPSPTYKAGYMIGGDSDSEDEEKVDLSNVPEDLLDMTEEDFEHELRKRFEDEMKDIHAGYKVEPIPAEAFRAIPEYVDSGKGTGDTDSSTIGKSRRDKGDTVNIDGVDVSVSELDSDDELLPKVVEVTDDQMSVDTHTGNTDRNKSTSKAMDQDTQIDSRRTNNDSHTDIDNIDGSGKTGVDSSGSKEHLSNSRAKVSFADDMGHSGTSADEGKDRTNTVEGVKKEKKSQQETISDEHLFYDPDEDENNQNWVDKHRAREPLNMRPADVSAGPKVVEVNAQSPPQQPQQTRPLFDTDGVLSCPCCMTTLCMDCQRHEKYNQQYRAMFVMNVKVMPEKLQHDPTDPTVYYPVRCEYCSTEVGVVDPDQVYHFFNVIASDPQ